MQYILSYLFFKNIFIIFPSTVLGICLFGTRNMLFYINYFITFSILFISNFHKKYFKIRIISRYNIISIRLRCFTWYYFYHSNPKLFKIKLSYIWIRCYVALKRIFFPQCSIMMLQCLFKQNATRVPMCIPHNNIELVYPYSQYRTVLFV